ncbi:MAG: hypothetical protein WD827_05770 [Solirubrobacterales bacterium]
MREKLNSNPLMQAAIVGVLLVVAAVFFLSMSGGEEEEAAVETTEATVSVAGTSATGTATGASPGEAVEGAIEAVEGVTPTSSAVPALPPEAAAAAPPPPRPVLDAFKANRTVALLFVHEDGIDDRLVIDAAKRIRSMPDVSVFVVPVNQIYRYAGIAQGVAVDRVPALVVLRPRNLSDTPQASVSYGFQSPESVVQTVIDAGYQGKTLDYHP